MDHNTPIQSTQPEGKETPVVALLAFLLFLLGAGLFAYVALTGWNAFSAGKLQASNVQRLLLGMQMTLLLSGASILFGVVTLFLKRRKKGLGILSLILSVLLFLVVGISQYVSRPVLFSYIYNNGSHTVGGRDEVIDFGDTQHETIAREEVDRIMQMQELDWPLLDETDVPETVRQYMYSKSPQSSGYLKPGAENIDNYILFGIDAYNLSDMIMVVSMDRVHKKVKLISIPRDTYVMVPEWGGYTKINHAYGVGQEESSIATLELNFKLKFKDYFTVHFSDVTELVDMIGGVEVSLDETELAYMHKNKCPDVELGDNYLDGREALVYARMRSSGSGDNEFKRTDRQREVLSSMYRSVKALPPSYYPDMVDTFAGLCKTSVETDKLLSMVLQIVGEGYTIETYSIIDMVDYWGGQFGPGNLYYAVYDLDAAGDVIYRTIYERYYVSGYPDSEE